MWRSRKQDYANGNTRRIVERARFGPQFSSTREVMVCVVRGPSSNADALELEAGATFFVLETRNCGAPFRPLLFGLSVTHRDKESCRLIPSPKTQFETP